MATKKQPTAKTKPGAKSAKAAGSGAKARKKTAGSPESASESPVKRFRALVNRKEGGEVCSINIPFDVAKTFGARGRVPVRGNINGAPYRTSVFRMGGDCHFMVVNREMREAAGVRGGETVAVTMERDTETRTVTPPADLARAIKANREAQATWDELSYTHRKGHVRAVEDAKKSETRQRRIETSVALLAAGKGEPR